MDPRGSINFMKLYETGELRAKILHETHWSLGEEPFQLRYRYPLELETGIDRSNGDPFLAAFLIPAMLLGENLTLEAEVSPVLLKHAQTTIQDVVCLFETKKAKRVEVIALNSCVIATRRVSTDDILHNPCRSESCKLSGLRNLTHRHVEGRIP